MMEEGICLMNGKRWAALILAIGLFLVSGVYQIATSGSAESSENLDRLLNEDIHFDEKVINSGNNRSKIVVLNLEGVIQDTGEVPFLGSLAYDHQRFLRMIEQAGKDDQVDGIILKVNTPGGGVVESAEIHDKVVEVQEKYEKPVYVSMGNTAASGGYYVSAPADKIVAHPATLTGSIGVIMEAINYEELADKLGIDFTTIKSGKFKDIMSASREMTEEEEVLLQDMIDDMYEDFVQVIVEGRDMTVSMVRDIADGRVFTGKQAEEYELVDALGTIEDTIAIMEEDYDLGDARVVQYGTAFGWESFFGLTAKSIFNKDAEINGLMEMIRDSSGPRAMYLYSR